MKREKNDFAVLVLAAGKGTRMRTETPKVLVPFHGKPLLLHVLDNIYESGCRKCVIVVGYGQEQVRSLVASESTRFSSGRDGMELVFAVQEKQLGTAHAVQAATEALGDDEGPLIVTAGDVPLLSAASLKALLGHHKSHANAITILSAFMEEPTGYGRIIRDENAMVSKIIEEKDANDAELAVKEINTGSYVFESSVIFSLIEKIGSTNAQQEYYLPDAIEFALRSGLRVDSLLLADSMEGRGINSLEELRELEQCVAQIKDIGQCVSIL